MGVLGRWVFCSSGRLCVRYVGDQTQWKLISMNEGKEIKDGGREEEEGLKRTTGKLWGDMEGERGAIMPLPPRPSFVLTFLFFSLTFCPSVLLSICPSTRPSFPPPFFTFFPCFRPSVRPNPLEGTRAGLRRRAYSLFELRVAEHFRDVSSRDQRCV